MLYFIQLLRTTIKQGLAVVFLTILSMNTTAWGQQTPVKKSGPSHFCANDALEKAKKLLLFDSNNDNRAQVSSVKEVGTIKALNGKGRYDVLEVEGYIYKGEYRIRLIYAQFPNDCVLMGQEIIQYGDPY